MAELLARLEQMLPAGCHAGGSDPTRHYPLMSGEDASAMVPRRAAEFSAGRQAARAAMGRAGLPAQALPQGPDRAPVWPAGLAGTISHSRRACLAAVSPGLAGLGLDLEENLPLAPELAGLIMHDRDRVGGWAGQADPALMVFCAKEAAYKAQYPTSARVFGPEVLAVEIGGAGFTARFLTAVGPFASGQTIQGAITLCAGHLLALAWIPAGRHGKARTGAPL